MSTLSIFERQLLANAITQLARDGLVMVPASMLRAAIGAFRRDFHSGYTLEYGFVDESESVSWLRCCRILQAQAEKGAVEIDTDEEAL